MRHDYRALAGNLQTRSISDDEIASLRRHADTVGKSAATAMQAKEKEFMMIHAAMGELYKKWPQKKTAYVGCEEKTLRDMKLVVRYAAYSCVLDDPQYANDRMYYWFRTILNAYQFGHEFIEDAYRFAQKRASQMMDPEESAALNGMLDEAIKTFNS